MAFDLVNRHILFYTLIKQGWSGRVINIMRNFYSKTYFRLKVNGRISPLIPSHIGVNQRGNVSGLLFRKYLSDLDEYLYNEVGICMEDTIIVHLLWADDLILASDSSDGLQRQLNDLCDFCCDNKMVVNDMKTRVMVRGSSTDNVKREFNSKVLDVVDQYKYLGNSIKRTKRSNEDIFGENYQYLCNRAKQAIFAIYKRLKNIRILPVKTMMYIFQSLVKPILVYGNEVWDVNMNAIKTLDKVFYGMRVL